MGGTLNYTAEDHRQAMKTWSRDSRTWSSLDTKKRSQIRDTLHKASAEKMTNTVVIYPLYYSRKAKGYPVDISLIRAYNPNCR